MQCRQNRRNRYEARCTDGNYAPSMGRVDPPLVRPLHAGRLPEVQAWPDFIDAMGKLAIDMHIEQARPVATADNSQILPSVCSRSAPALAQPRGPFLFLVGCRSEILKRPVQSGRWSTADTPRQGQGRQDEPPHRPGAAKLHCRADPSPPRPDEPPAPRYESTADPAIWASAPDAPARPALPARPGSPRLRQACSGHPRLDRFAPATNRPRPPGPASALFARRRRGLSWPGRPGAEHARSRAG